MLAWLKALAIAGFAILAPVHTVMATAGALIAIDLIMGIAAAIKKKEAVTSAALRRTLSKVLVYQVAIITGFLCEQYLIDGLVPISKLVGSVIGLVEAKSILENADIIYGSSIFGSIISKLGSQNDKKE